MKLPIFSVYRKKVISYSSSFHPTTQSGSLLSHLSVSRVEVFQFLSPVKKSLKCAKIRRSKFYLTTKRGRQVPLYVILRIMVLCYYSRKNLLSSHLSPLLFSYNIDYDCNQNPCLFLGSLTYIPEGLRVTVQNYPIFCEQIRTITKHKY